MATTHVLLVTKLRFVTHYRAKLRFAWAGCLRVGRVAWVTHPKLRTRRHPLHPKRSFVPKCVPKPSLRNEGASCQGELSKSQFVISIPLATPTTQLPPLDQLTGDAFDQAFLTQMIAHHAMAVQMARPAGAVDLIGGDAQHRIGE